MSERIKITVRASGAHPDILTVQDAMRQVLDFFEMRAPVPGVQWKLVNASTNSPLSVEGEAVSLEPTVDVSVIARAQKKAFEKNIHEIASGSVPDDPDFRVNVAKRFFARALNGVGGTEIDFGDAAVSPITITPRNAKIAIDALEQKPPVLFEKSVARDEIGSIEGTLQDVGTHYNFRSPDIADFRD